MTKTYAALRSIVSLTDRFLILLEVTLLLVLPQDRDGVPHIGGVCYSEAYSKENEADDLANCGKEEDGKLVDRQVCLCDTDLCNGANSVMMGTVGTAMALVVATFIRLLE